MANKFNEKIDSSELHKLWASLDKKAERSVVDALQLKAELAFSEMESESKWKTEIEDLKKIFKQNSKQFAQKLDECLGEMAQSKVQSAQISSQLLLKAEREDLEAFKQAFDRRNSTLKAEIQKQSAELAEELQKLAENMIAIKNTFKEDSHKNGKQINKKQEGIIAETERLKASIDFLRKETADQIDSTVAMLKNFYLTSQKTIESELEATKMQLESLINAANAKIETKISQTEFQKMKKDTRKELKSKTSVTEVKDAIANLQSEAEQKYSEMAGILDSKLNEVKTDLLAILKKKATLREVEVSLSQKVSVPEFQVIQDNIIQKIDQLEQKLKTKDKKASYRLTQAVTQLSENVVKVEQELQNKVKVTDLPKIMDQKANVDDLNLILTTLQKQIHQKAESNLLEKVVKEQLELNDYFYSESIVARYKWKSGATSNGNLIDFEIESVNTLKENFVWTKGAAAVVVVHGGIYQISFGVFGKQKSQIRLLINGELIISQISQQMSNSKQAINSSTKSPSIFPKEDDKTSGHATVNKSFTFSDFFDLPANCKVSLVCSTEIAPEGFINFKRL